MKKIIKYFKKNWFRYGLETLVVVNGVLIAFALNNWNENRKATISQNEVLEKLKNDIVSDTIRFKSLDSLYETWDIQAEYIVNEVLDGDVHINTVYEYMIGRGSMNYLNLKTTTFNEMINTGLFYQIKDQVLAQYISSYYEFADFEVNKVNRDNRDFYGWVLNTGGSDYINIVGRLSNQKNLEYTDFTWLKDPSSIDYKQFEARVGFHKEAIRVNRFVMSQLSQRGEKVIAKINDHQQKIK